MVGLKDMIDGWIEGMIDGWIEGQGSGGLVFPRFCVVSLRCVAPCRPCCRAAAFPLPPARSLARLSTDWIAQQTVAAISEGITREELVRAFSMPPMQ